MKTLRCLVWLASLMLPVLSYGDWISLKHGGRITGEIVRQNSREITIRAMDGGILTFQMRQIKKFHRNDSEKRVKEEKAKALAQKNKGRRFSSGNGTAHILFNCIQLRRNLKPWLSLLSLMFYWPLY